MLNNQEVLVKAINLAIDRGWEFDNLDKWKWSAIKKTDTVMNNWYYFLLAHDGKEKFIDAERIIFDHDFAKALWPITLPVAYDTRIPESKPQWIFHLQNMVVAPDPIAYLGEHI